MGLARKEVYEKIREKFPDGVEGVVEVPGDPYCVLKKEAVLPVCRWLKDDPDMRFDLCVCVGGADDTKDFWVTWHLHSIPKNQDAVLKLKVGREDPSAPSVVSLWKGADWHEREAFDLYGIRFEGHPDLRRILLPDDWRGHPLRKDYEFPDEYQGIPLK